ncbi:tenascin [Drosophila nasuta]|uniref:tenascin n=1 Tax=Drosophila nasuta TaxID=42062 RepID=UPI00295E7F41|nr:tenascin [Drosophila nasuta]
MKKNIIFCISFLIFCNYFAIINAYGHVCLRRDQVTYMDEELAYVSVPYKEKNWYGRYVVKTRMQFQWVPKLKYKFQNTYYCCEEFEYIEKTCPEHSYCSSSYAKCVCYDGYSGDDCTLIDCDNCGTNMHCYSPNKCECNTGYHKIYDDDVDCVPECNPRCGAHSFCSSPNNCECEVGYKAVVNGYNSTDCRPICAEECAPHSSCTAPGKCECDEGWHMTDGKCQPICSLSCQEHSICKAPEFCECVEGYQQREPDVCVPSCPKGCAAFARCVSPNQCECYDGYEISAESAQECVPKCMQGCPNGRCIAPEKCACNSGYLMGPQNSCEPQCSPACQHGICTGPDTCECEAGYRFAANSQHICEPICEPSCQNAACLAPQICICDVHYEMDMSAPGHVCKPSCQLECVNGTCVSPDVCGCLPGYTGPTVEGNSSICRPHCSGGCENGVCTAPDTCVCFAGYESSSQGCQRVTTTTTSTTSISTTISDTPPSDTTEDLSEYCSSSCKCWTEQSTENGVNTSGKCFSKCMDDFEKACLHPSKCRCNKSTGQLHCDVDGSSELRTFFCSEISPKDDLSSKEAALNASTSDQSAINWQTILVWCVAITVLLAMISTVAYLYLRHESQQPALYSGINGRFENVQ